jgi:amphiphysin
MKGIGKALARTPFAVTSKIGMSKKSTDPEFDDYQRNFTSLEQAAEKLIKDTKAFTEAIIALFTAGASFSQHFAVVFQPIAGEYDLIGKHPDASHTIRNVTKYESAMQELRELIGPELELIETRIAGPAKELQFVMKLIRKTITKRDHKLTDYDRFNNSLTKLRDKKDKSLSDEKNLFKLEQDFEIATNEYEYINNALKQDFPRFMMLATQFIDPLFNSFFYMQLNIYYLLLEKMNSFADESKYDISNVPGAQITQEYESKRTDAWSVIENLGIIKRIISVSRMVQVSRAQSGQTSLGRQTSVAGTSPGAPGLKVSSPPTRSVSGASGYKKTPPPPPSISAQAAAPPPYTPSASLGSGTSVAAATKRAPPPPPPLKPKPKPTPQIKYVVALYDFAAQADGDLSFNAGDRIELVEKTDGAEDWWTGRLNGAQGVFPGNYVQET